MRIEDEIKQKRFADEFEKADINIIFTANWMAASFNGMIKAYGISQQQFNILRILKGQLPNPAPLKVITERMMDRMSNTSRLVEKMQKKGLLERNVCESNRRQVDILITDKGVEVCNEVSRLIEEHRKKNLKINEEEARQLNAILDKMRS